MVCECPYQEVALNVESVIFTGLDPEEQYFPLVSRLLDGAVFGLAPDPVGPLLQSEDLSMDDSDHIIVPMNKYRDN